ncbi:MAG TPA: DUF996 domain-containing protein [Candidatus Bathyarchaeia archaeon]|nr:DUF996 domain-containing protein [Candidatus Bathyarchaeia archaeon]HEX4920565.1 DUF996 domain-containing protein [Candidatus Bathyarchaeia archaeon]
MASLSNAKTMGGIGGILVFIPGISLVGWILILIALKDISDVVQDKSIFDNALLAGITAIIGSVVLAVFTFFAAAAFGFFTLGFFGVLAAFWVLAVISAVFLKNAYDRAAQKLNNSSFGTAGLLYLIGAITTIVLVGFLILFIALIFQVVAYFSINDQPMPPAYPGFQAPPSFYPSPPPAYPATPTGPQQPATPSTTVESPADVKFCHKCGAKMAKTADYCTMCGTKQS